MKKPFEIIRDLREDKDLKQKEVADYLQMSRTTYNHYELGHTSLNEDIIIKLSKFYNVSPNFILNYSEKNEIVVPKSEKAVLYDMSGEEGSINTVYYISDIHLEHQLDMVLYQLLN